jgi:hypothetical protein
MKPRLRQAARWRGGVVAARGTRAAARQNSAMGFIARGPFILLWVRKCLRLQASAVLRETGASSQLSTRCGARGARPATRRSIRLFPRYAAPSTLDAHAAFCVTDVNSLLHALKRVPVGADQILEEAHMVRGHHTPP